MIEVELKASTDVNPLELASYAAFKCYQAENPAWGKLIDVENRLFDVSHHTTLEHPYYTFDIEGIAVGDVTFGLHLTHPFYNSDQRSGRYCAKMFLEPNFNEIEKYIMKFWPEVVRMKAVMDYVKKGVAIYHKNIKEASRISAEMLKRERPFISEKNLEANTPKIAQEQMRMFIPVIFPTGLEYTVDLIVLASLHCVAWTPSMRFVVEEMVRLAVKKNPEIAFMFSDDSKSDNLNNWAMDAPSGKNIKMKLKPTHRLLEISGEKNFVFPSPELMNPVDLLHFDPRMMDNSTGGLKTKIEISVATMGQDQRHRTISRSEPSFTGAFYLPPILKKIGMEKEAKDLMKDWVNISKNIPTTLAMILAPYGAMVGYEKRGSFNAVAHEQGKRLCFCAQEEIYHAGRELRLAIERRNRKSKLLRIFEPPCYRTGKCAEGVRYCGRNLKLRKTGDFFPKRKI